MEKLIGKIVNKVCYPWDLKLWENTWAFRYLTMSRSSPRKLNKDLIVCTATNTLSASRLGLILLFQPLPRGAINECSCVHVLGSSDGHEGQD